MPNVVEKYIKKNDLKVEQGFILRFDKTIDYIDGQTKVDYNYLVKEIDGYLEQVHYIDDDNFMVIVDEEGIYKNKPFNLLGYLAFGYYFYGDIIIIKKGVLK